MERQFQCGDEVFKISANRVGDYVKLIDGDGNDRAFDFERLGEGEYVLRDGGKQHRVVVARDGKERWLWIDGRIHQIKVVTGGRRKKDEDEGGLTAPMNGLVLKVLVAAGESVTKKQPLVVLEAMKMQYEITAPRDGVIESVHCNEGQQVEGGFNLVSLEEVAAEAAPEA